MEAIDFILIGGGDQGCVTADTIISCGHRVIRVFDSRECEPLPGLHASGDYDPENKIRGKIIISIGNNIIRKQYAGQVYQELGSIIHPTAIVSKNVILGGGSVVLQGAIVQINSVIGKHVIINTRASVDHDARIGDYVHIAPGAVLCGRVTIGEGALIGAGSVILPGMTVGKWAVVSAGSVVTVPVADGEIVRGNPARLIKVESQPT